jgi:hypothetical protein
MNHSVFRWLRRLAHTVSFALLLSTCSTDGDSSRACKSLCSDVCQTLPGCGLEVAVGCTDECVAGLGDLDCSAARPVGQLTCAELAELYACAEYCAAFCTSAVACGPFDERLCAIGCASETVLCNARSVAARSCDQLKPEARLYEDLGRAQQSDSDDVFISGGARALSAFGLCGDADDCDSPLGCSVETNTCEACVSNAECTKEFAAQPSVCTAEGACLEVDCVTDDDCNPGNLCDTQAHTCIECARDEHCATRPLASLRPACDIASNSCVECNQDEHCAAGPSASLFPACDIGNNGCVECTRNEHCSSPRGLCSLADFSCAECLTNADCPIESPRCSDSGAFCTPCDSDADCAGRGLPACSVFAGGCVECSSNVHCTEPARPECDLILGQCVPLSQ